MANSMLPQTIQQNGYQLSERDRQVILAHADSGGLNYSVQIERQHTKFMSDHGGDPFGCEHV